MAAIDRAVVVGGSIAGLAAAAALSSRADEVLLVERRTAPPGGSVAPQGHLPHVLLAAGGQVLEHLFPGFAARLIGAGAVDGSADPTRLACHWAAAGAVRDHLQLTDLGFPRALCSRTLIESHLRAATLGLTNVTSIEASVAGLDVAHRGRAGSVTGVRLHGTNTHVEADLVVDASGRGTRSPTWLEDAGLPGPRTSEVVVDLRYTAFFVERKPGDFDGAAFVVVQNTPELPRIGVALPMENDGWQVVLGGYFGDTAPTEIAEAVGFARSLTEPILGDLVARRQLRRPARYTFRSSLRRHWEELTPIPSGLVAVGDAVASFNPLYGQGMSSALLQVAALSSVLDRYGNDAGSAQRYARRAARVVANPWLTATGADFVYADTTGSRPFGNHAVNRYVDRVIRAAAVDESVNAALTGVQQMLAPPPSLFRPQVALRTLAHGARTKSPTAWPARSPADTAGDTSAVAPSG